MITLQIQDDDGAIRRALNALVQASANLSQPLKVIGDNLKESTQQRFHDSKGPDGTPWAANTEATYLSYLSVVSGAYDKQGKRTANKEGWYDKHGRVAAPALSHLIQKKPLLGETRLLSSTIYNELVGEMAVAVGSGMEYAAMQQFGGKKSDYPWLWGDIPARPFLGASTDDRAMILDVLARYLKKAVG